MAKLFTFNVQRLFLIGWLQSAAIHGTNQSKARKVGRDMMQVGRTCHKHSKNVIRQAKSAIKVVNSCQGFCKVPL